MADFNEYKGVWVFCEQRQGALMSTDFELVSEARKLADELGYTGDKSDTAAMNMWLHKNVLANIAANGGNVPAELLD